MNIPFLSSRYNINIENLYICVDPLCVTGETEGGVLGGTSHHHLAMVVVEMGFVLERITDDELGAVERVRREIFKEIWTEQVSRGESSF